MPTPELRRKSPTIAMIGAGRVAQALARRWRESGVEVGMWGRDAIRVADAVRFVGPVPVLSRAELRDAEVAVIAIADGAIGAFAATLVAEGPIRPGSIWCHVSGVHGPAVLDPLRLAGAHTAAMHPACPVPTPAAGYRLLPGCTALIDGAAEAGDRLSALARRAGLRPVMANVADRGAYHAACALAANGATALAAVAIRLAIRATGIAQQDAERLIGSLGGAAMAVTGERGAVGSLTGPVARGDAEVVARHLAGLTEPADIAVYRSLMTVALELAVERGLEPERAARIREVLDG